MYVSKGSTHTPGTLCVIPSRLLKWVSKLTLYKTSFHSERVENVYPKHVNSLLMVSLSPPIFLTMGESWKYQNGKHGYWEWKTIWIQQKEKHKFLFLCCILTLFFYIYPQGDQQAKTHLIYLGWEYECPTIDLTILINYST